MVLSCGGKRVPPLRLCFATTLPFCGWLCQQAEKRHNKCKRRNGVAPCIVGAVSSLLRAGDGDEIRASDGEHHDSDDAAFQTTRFVFLGLLVLSHQWPPF